MIFLSTLFTFTDYWGVRVCADVLPCRNFYNAETVVGDGSCFCNEKNNDNSTSNHLWHYRPKLCPITGIGELKRDEKKFTDKLPCLEGGAYSRTWHNCKSSDEPNPNLNYVFEQCDSTDNFWWGNSFDLPEVAPEGVWFAMKCEIPDPVPTCLCRNINSTEQEKTCGFPFNDVMIGYKNNSNPKFCQRLKQMIYKPFETSCRHYIECDFGLYCNCSGICDSCRYMEQCPCKKRHIWPTCSYGTNNCPSYCSEMNGKCGAGYSSCCRGFKCDNEREGECIHDTCQKNGTCIDDYDGCANYGCLNGTVVYAERQECHSTDNIANSSCTDGTICSDSTNRCYRSTDEPKVIYNTLNVPCDGDYDCDVNLLCKQSLCQACPPDGSCPEKIEPNIPTCKRGEYDCPAKCSRLNETCDTRGAAYGSCCRGFKCNNQAGGKCIRDYCKKYGLCIDDSDCCAGYGCLNGTVVYAEGQECYTTDNIANPNCTGGTMCTEAHTCYLPNVLPKITYNPINYKGCYTPSDCDVGLYCTEISNVDGKGICSTCLVDEGCPEKVLPNERTCKFGENNCPNYCARLGDLCGTQTSAMRPCRGMKCDGTELGTVIHDLCKNNGSCNDYDDICPKYGCLNGIVVYAEGQICQGTGKNPNCTDGTVCNGSQCVYD